MKRNFIPFLLTLFLSPTIIFSQIGPGGIGNSSDNLVWLDANRLSLPDNSAISSWTDFSGNNNHAIQASSSRQPLFKTSLINGISAVDFDGSNDFLQFSSHITTDQTSVFTVHQSQSTAINGVLTLQKHFIYSISNAVGVSYTSPNKYYTFPFSQNDPTIFQFHTDNWSRV